MSTEPERPRRLSLSDIVQRLLDRDTEPHSSVTLTSTAKGDTSIEVKVRTGGADSEVVTIDQAEAKARAVYDRLRAEYAPASAGEQATVALSRNAKGDTQVEVQVRTGEGGAETAEAAEAKARDIYERLRGLYPLADGTVGRKGGTS